MFLPKLKLLFCVAGCLFVASSAPAPATAGTAEPSLDGLWSGEFTSERADAQGTLAAELLQDADGNLTGRLKMQGDGLEAPMMHLLPYMEQDNVFKVRVAAGDVNGDGIACLIANGKSADGTMFVLMIDAMLLPAGTDGEAPLLFGTYELFQVEGDGKFKQVDAGTLGIIAVLIG